jgi:hypothetical protein
MSSSNTTAFGAISETQPSSGDNTALIGGNCRWHYCTTSHCRLDCIVVVRSRERKRKRLSTQRVRSSERRFTQAQPKSSIRNRQRHHHQLLRFHGNHHHLRHCFAEQLSHKKKNEKKNPMMSLILLLSASIALVHGACDTGRSVNVCLSADLNQCKTNAADDTAKCACVTTAQACITAADCGKDAAILGTLQLAYAAMGQTCEMPESTALPSVGAACSITGSTYCSSAVNWCARVNRGSGFPQPAVCNGCLDNYAACFQRYNCRDTNAQTAFKFAGLGFMCGDVSARFNVTVNVGGSSTSTASTTSTSGAGTGSTTATSPGESTTSGASTTSTASAAGSTTSTAAGASGGQTTSGTAIDSNDQGGDATSLVGSISVLAIAFIAAMQV